MKKPFLVLAIAALLVGAGHVSKAADVSFDFFYSNLSGGSWIEVGDYGYCWQPDLAVSDSSWRPYSDGYWTYTDLGWTWVSYEDFGWATYHYGRWARLADYGWVWVPGRDQDLVWAPAWVSWRTGGEYIGWAPLPPETIGIVYEGRPVRGHVDVEFGIGPAWYNFVDVRYIGAPVLRERIVSVNENVTYVNQTVNVTNITYNNSTVYNYGPDYNAVNAHAAQPVQRLKLERQENVDVAAAARSGGLVKPQGDKLVVAAPMKITKPTGSITPPTVKTRVPKPNVDKGWGIVSDPKVKTELQQKMKTEDVKQAQIGAGAGITTGQGNTGANVNAAASASVPPTWRGKTPKNIQPTPGAQTNVNTNVNAGASVPPTWRGKAPKNIQPTPGAQTNTNVNTGASVPPTSHGKGNKGAETDVSTGATNNPGGSVPPTDLRGKGKHDTNAGAQWRQNPNAEFARPTSSAGASESDVSSGAKTDHKLKGVETQTRGPLTNNPAVSEGTEATGGDDARRFRKTNQPPASNVPNAGTPSTVTGGENPGKPNRFNPVNTPAQGGAAGPQIQERGAGAKNKDNKHGKSDASPTP